MAQMSKDGSLVPSSSTSIDCSLLDSLECSICAVVFKDPKQLNCGHTFCAACITKLAETAIPTTCDNAFAIRTISISCPQCRTHTPVPRNGIQHMVTNFIVKEMVSKMESVDIKRTQSDTDLPEPFLQCSTCPKRVPKEESFVCATCRSKIERTKYICSLCALKAHKDHNLIVFADLANDACRYEGTTAVQNEIDKSKNYLEEIQSEFSEIYIEFEKFYKVLTRKFDLSNSVLEELIEQIRNPEITPFTSDLRERYDEALLVGGRSSRIRRKVSELKYDLLHKLDEFSKEYVYEKPNGKNDVDHCGTSNENVFTYRPDGKTPPRAQRKPAFKFTNRNAAPFASEQEQSNSVPHSSLPTSNNN
uniref:RING-type domain-containing protein n=1 Tax=Ditylenchus dipsaci TaxID=166011 RepID=A0A915EA07_9BILA